MRAIYTAFVIIMAAAVILFCVQNLENAPMRFLGWSISLPLALLVLAAYVLGMLTGGTAVSFIRRLIHGATAKPKEG